MTIHYHGTPITPLSTLTQLAGRHFCVSYSRPDQVHLCHRLGQSVMHDNGAFSVWKKTQQTVFDWSRYYEWVEPLLGNAAHWAVIPDEIDSGSQAQDYLVSQWPFRTRGAPVWHMDEPLDRLLRLADEWPRVCVGSTAEYRTVGSGEWRGRMDEVFDELSRRHRLLPWLHMLRGMQCSKWPYPFASVDSTDIGRNHNRGKAHIAMIRSVRAWEMAERWDRKNCPGHWAGRSDT